MPVWVSVLLAREPDGVGRLIDVLGLDADDVTATLTTGAPSVRVLSTTAGEEVAEALRTAGTLPPVVSAVLTVTADGTSGQLGLRLSGEGTQEDADERLAQGLSSGLLDFLGEGG